MRLRVTLIMVTVAMAGCLGGDEEPEPRTSFSFRGDGCEETLVYFPADAAAARGFVPGEFALAGEATGTVTAFAGLKSCETLAVDGGDAAPGMVSDVGFVLEPPLDDLTTLHYYQAWVVTDHAGFAAAHRETGVRTGLDLTSYDAGSLVQTYGTRGYVGWSEGPYKVEATGLLETFPMDLEVVGWHQNENGTWRVDKSFTVTEGGTGLGSVLVPGESPMGQITGGESVDGVALIARYDHTGSARYV